MLYLWRNKCLAVTSGCFKTLWKYRGHSYKSTSYSHRYRTPLTLKVNKDDEVIVLEVITPPEVKVLHKVPPAPRWTSVAITGSVIRPHLGGIVPEQLSIRCWRTETDRDRHEEWSCWLQSSEKAGRFNDCLVILWLVSRYHCDSGWNIKTTLGCCHQVLQTAFMTPLDFSSRKIPFGWHLWFWLKCLN